MLGIPVTFIPWDGDPEVVLDGTETAEEAAAKIESKLDELEGERA